MLQRALLLALVLIATFAANLQAAEPSPAELLNQSKRLLFLGDSITWAGMYVADFDAWLVTRGASHSPQVIDAGLPSETVSGLSEEGHAGGAFPRPDLAERLDRVLKLAKPDLVIACYGINCGIYQPFDERRFEQYQVGMRNVKSEVEKAGAHFIVMTPPFYDDMRAPLKFSYNAVLDRYSEWLVQQREHGWHVIDLHGPMTRAIQDRRKTDPQFSVQPDGVHPNDQGQWMVAQQLIRWFGDEKASSAPNAQEMLAARGAPPQLLPLVRQRVNVLRDAYVGAAGHKRPGVAKGLPVEEAEKKAAELTGEIDRLLKK